MLVTTKFSSHEADVYKMAFRCLGALGIYEWVVISFDLKNVSVIHQRAMYSIFHGLINIIVKLYIYCGQIPKTPISYRRSFVYLRAYAPTQVKNESQKNAMLGLGR